MDKDMLYICIKCDKSVVELHKPIRLEREYCESCTEELDDLYGELCHYGMA